MQRACVLVAVLWCAAVAATSGQTRTVQDGVYTAAQAQRGQAQFDLNCAMCHQPDLSGDGLRPPLKGPSFVSSWEMASVGELFSVIRRSMPQNSVASVTDAGKLDIVSYILQSNGFPTGSEELVPERPGLNAILIVGRGGPTPPRARSLVHAVGCLTQRPDGSWVLTDSSAPARARTGVTSTGSDLERARAIPRGSATVVLLNGSPDRSMTGRRVEAKGLLMKSADGDRIDVSSLAVIADACESGDLGS
jgi:mono/diheme cytochrome c family protein